MTATTLVPVDEYLRDYVEKEKKPSWEYIDGVLRQKPMGSFDHGTMQVGVGVLVEQRFPEFRAATEVHVRITPTEFLVPDLVIVRKEQPLERYPGKPVHVCVEIISPDDTFGQTVIKCHEYHRWGVPMCWIVDPVARKAWNFANGELPREVPANGALEAPEIAIPVADLFARIPVA